MPSLASIAYLLCATLIPQDTSPVPFAELLKKAPSRQVVEIPKGITQVQESSLPSDSGDTLGGKDLINNPSEMLDRKSQRRYKADENPATSVIEPGDRLGRRLFLIRLEPGEKLQVESKKSLTAGFEMTLLLPKEGHDTLKEQIAAVNRLPPQFRNRRIRIVNTADQHHAVLLKLVGPLNHSYLLEVNRSR